MCNKVFILTGDGDRTVDEEGEEMEEVPTLRTLLETPVRSVLSAYFKYQEPLVVDRSESLGTVLQKMDGR